MAGAQTVAGTIRWRLHLASGRDRVWEALSSDAGRARFWAEAAPEREGCIHFSFPNGYRWQGRVLERVAPRLLRVEYIGGSQASLELWEASDGGTELELNDRGVAPEYQAEVMAGWVSVLLALKAAVDHGVDLRNHDRQRCWDQGYVEN